MNGKERLLFHFQLAGNYKASCGEVHIDCYDRFDTEEPYGYLKCIKFITSFTGTGTTYYNLLESQNKMIDKVFMKSGCQKAMSYITDMCDNSSDFNKYAVYTKVGEGSYHFVGSHGSQFLAVHSAPTSFQDRLLLEVRKSKLERQCKASNVFYNWLEQNTMCFI